MSPKFHFAFIAAMIAALECHCAHASDERTLSPVQVEGTVPPNPDGSTPASGGFLVTDPGIGPFGTASQLDVPFSITSIPRVLIDAQQSKSVNDALRNDPSTYEDAPTSRWGYSNILIRGFDASDSQSNRMDGLPFTTQASEELYDIERVDVFKGVNGLLYGFSNPGGVVNYVTKKPLEVALTRVTVDYAEQDWIGGTLDVSRRFGTDDQFGARVNLAEHSGDLAIAGQHNTDSLGALALDWRFAPASRLWVNASRSRNDYRGLQPSFSITTPFIPAAPDPSTLYGQRYERQIGTTTSYLAGAETSFLPWLTAHATAGVITGDRDVRQGGAFILDGSGDYRSQVNPHNIWQLRDYSEEIGLTALYDAGVLVNKLDLDGTFNRETYNVHRVQAPAILGTFNFADPVAIPDPVPYVIGATSKSDTHFNNYVLRDTLELSKRWIVIAGVAHSTTSHYDSFSASDSYSQSKTTPSVGLVFKPIELIGIYASYIRGLQAGAQAADTFNGATVTNANAYLPPYASTQYEAGVKVTLNQALQLNADVFQIKNPNALYIPNAPPLTSYTFAADGQQRNRGAEFTAIGQVITGWRVFGGVTLLQPVIVASQGGSIDGKDAIGVPRQRANLFTEYDIAALPGLTLLGGIYFTSEVYANSLNTQRVPSFATVDLGAQFATRLGPDETEFRFYAQNFTNKHYWSTLTTDFVQVGDPRTIKASIVLKL